jgi:protein-histidine pros-kinase
VIESYRGGMDTGGELADAARAHADVEAIRRRVVNVVGHALRTPVTTMAGMAAALESTADDETRAVLVHGLARNARRVERLLDDLLVAARVTTAAPVGDPEPVDCTAVVRDVWVALGGPGSPCIEGPYLTALVRPASFERIVQAIVDNALKYGEGDVVIRGEPLSGGIRLEVESSGLTPTDDELEHAFEMLYRGEHAVTTAPGLGIGLAVARELARAEGGDLTLRRRHGSVVATLELPA